MKDEYIGKICKKRCDGNFNTGPCMGGPVMRKMCMRIAKIVAENPTNKMVFSDQIELIIQKTLLDKVH